MSELAALLHALASAPPSSSYPFEFQSGLPCMMKVLAKCVLSFRAVSSEQQ